MTFGSTVRTNPSALLQGIVADANVNAPPAGFARIGVSRGVGRDEED